MRKLFHASPRSGSCDAAITRSRIDRVAMALMLALLSIGGAPSVSEASTKKQCETALSKGIRRCLELAEYSQCTDQAWRSYNKCSCGADGGVYSETLGSPHCTGGSNPYSVGPSDVPRKPKGPQQVAPQPLSNPPEPTKPKGPGSAGTPPKSNPTDGKPQGPGNVTAPKSSSSSGGGTILRSGDSNTNNSGGGGNSGGSKR